MRRRTVTVNDKMQKGYRYALSAPAGRNFDAEFRPRAHAGPDAPARRVRRQVHDRLPPRISRKLVRRRQTRRRQGATSLNFFGVDASQPLSEWRRKGWIHPDDPRGWFQWYCRYYMGRRMPEEDERQIGRWKAIRRHVRQIEKHCEPGDLLCRPRQRQALLHWAYDSRKI